MTYTREMYGMPPVKEGDNDFYKASSIPAGAMAIKECMKMVQEGVDLHYKELFELSVDHHTRESAKHPVKKTGPRMRKVYRKLGLGEIIDLEDETPRDKARRDFPHYDPDLTDEERRRLAEPTPYPFHNEASQKAFDEAMARPRKPLVSLYHPFVVASTQVGDVPPRSPSAFSFEEGEDILCIVRASKHENVDQVVVDDDSDVNDPDIDDEEPRDDEYSFDEDRSNHLDSARDDDMPEDSYQSSSIDDREANGASNNAESFQGNGDEPDNSGSDSGIVSDAGTLLSPIISLPRAILENGSPTPQYAQFTIMTKELQAQHHKKRLELKRREDELIATKTEREQKMAEEVKEQANRMIWFALPATKDFPLSPRTSPEVAGQSSVPPKLPLDPAPFVNAEPVKYADYASFVDIPCFRVPVPEEMLPEHERGKVISVEEVKKESIFTRGKVDIKRIAIRAFKKKSIHQDIKLADL